MYKFVNFCNLMKKKKKIERNAELREKVVTLPNLHEICGCHDIIRNMRHNNCQIKISPPGEKKLLKVSTP